MLLEKYTGNFPEDLYDLQSPFSHIRKILESFLDSIEDVRSRLLLEDIREAIDTIQFYHLDRLFGDTLRFPRIDQEIYELWDDEIPTYKNIVSDPLFDNNGAPWTYSGTASKKAVPNAFQGTYVVLLKAANDAVEQEMVVNPNRQYNISFRARAVNAVGTATGRFGNTTGSEWGSRSFTLPAASDTAEWQTISGVFQPIDTTGRVVIICDTGAFEVSAIQVTEGSNLYPFTTTNYKGVALNPEFDDVTNEQWAEMMAKDAEYRERIKAFMKAIQLGGTKESIRWAYRAATGKDPGAVLENYRYQDLIVGRTVLTELLTTAADTTISNKDTNYFPEVGEAGFPASAKFKIDSEIFSYTGKTATSFTGVARAQDGTVAAAHSLGSQIEEVDPAKDSTLGIFDPLGATEFTIVPDGPISFQEKQNVFQVVNRLKPSGTVFNVDEQGIQVSRLVRINSAEASSEHYEVERKTQTRKRNSEYLSDDVERQKQARASSERYSELRFLV